ncbi:hypothetical protein [Pseudomonas paeninsulae]|nr:hypothetical protein [Pseudomonas sp. IT1137]
MGNVADFAYFLRIIGQGLLHPWQVVTFADFYFDALISFRAV